MFTLRVLAQSMSRTTFRVPINSFKWFCCFEQPQSIKQPVCPCRITCNPVVKKPCFDLNKVEIIRANDSHAELIRSFLYSYFWPREPSVVGLWMDLNSPYLRILTEKYATSGDRFLALERLDRADDYKCVGIAIANKVYPWAVGELEEWAHYTNSKPERHRLYFCAHLLKSPDLFKKYKIDYVYEVEVLATAPEVSGHGVGALLLNFAMSQAAELRHPLVQVLAVSAYTAKICEKVGMKREWTMDYTEFVDNAGQRVFFPRRPHTTVAVYTKPFK